MALAPRTVTTKCGAGPLTHAEPPGSAVGPGVRRGRGRPPHPRFRFLASLVPFRKAAWIGCGFVSNGYKWFRFARVGPRKWLRLVILLERWRLPDTEASLADR